MSCDYRRLPHSLAVWLLLSCCRLVLQVRAAPTAPKHPSQKPSVAIPHQHHDPASATAKYHDVQNAIDELFASGKPPPKRPPHHEHHERNRQHAAGMKRKQQKQQHKQAKATKGTQDAHAHEEL
mmetsp:Transcript_22160/g.40764  ORF Transcript_22160/g.40764 Transcript_22160/m.40764 type:complete len:124 (-) Transcript_22160:45-416(-)